MKRVSWIAMKEGLNNEHLCGAFIIVMWSVGHGEITFVTTLPYQMKW
jgi:hypothetical protein